MSSGKTILKVLVGSRAHGLEREDSDYDYRGVFIVPTTEILSIDSSTKSVDWIEGNVDNTAYELEHFLSLALKGNPTILETLLAPVVESTEDGLNLRKLFQYIWEPTSVYKSFTGYGYNQRKKFLEDKDKRANKYAVCWIRTLYNLIELLGTGTWTVNIGKSSISTILRSIQEGILSKGKIIDIAEGLVKTSSTLLQECKQKPNKELLNQFLLDMRHKYWGPLE